MFIGDVRPVRLVGAAASGSADSRTRWRRVDTSSMPVGATGSSTVDPVVSAGLVMLVVCPNGHTEFKSRMQQARASRKHSPD
ncbi:hypothetical protein GCM10010166_54170 [Couchioplanes caeruleus subsp. azureus]|nr:hypothetical protein GCM10010166_54170 [Couchioplanes caeruleus subsp. azureus]